MASQIPQFTLPVPNSLSQTSEEFEGSVNTLVSELPGFVEGANQIASEVNQKALDVEAAAGAIANQAWVSGTTYTAGAVRYSPVDFLNYRRKTNGAGTTDPSLDTTNWALLTKTVFGGSDTTTSAVDIDLSATAGRLQVIAMTAAGKKVTLPAATGVAKGTPIFVIVNSGSYRFAVRKNGGAFLCMVTPGQTLSIGCSDNTTSAGVWSVNGGKFNNIFEGNTPQVLNAVDTQDMAIAMLSPTKAICCYKNGSTTFLNAIIINFGSASGSVTVISAEAVRNVSVAALTASKVVVVYQVTGTNSTVKGFVLDISGDTITPGSVQTITTQAGTAAASTSLAVLSSTKLLIGYMRGSSSVTQEKVLDVSGTTITASAEVQADSSAVNSNLDSAVVGAITATKAIVGFLRDNSQFCLRHQTITGSTPAASGSVLTLSQGLTTLSAACLVVMSSSRVVVVRSVDQSFGGRLLAYVIDTSGTSPALLYTKYINVTYAGGALHLVGTKLDDTHVYITWRGGYGGIDGCVLTVTSDDRVIPGEIIESIDPATGYQEVGAVDAVALDSTHIMQVCRNTSNFLSAKVLEVSL